MPQPADDPEPPAASEPTGRAIDAYLECVAELWPATELPGLRHMVSTARPPSSEYELLVLPDATRPRLLVPAARRTAAARGMLRFSAALSAREVAQRLGVAALLRSGSDRVFPERIHARESTESLRSHLGDLFGEPVDLTVGLGTARVNRKPVLQIFDRRGRSLAFAKLGETPSTRALVAGEAQALRRLAGAELSPVLEVPALIHMGQWRGHSLLVMSALPSSVRQRPRRQFDVPHDAMRLLHDAFVDEETELADTAFWRRLEEQTGLLEDEGAEGADRLRRAVRILRTRFGRVPVRTGAWHGDWTPWNMSRGQGRVQLWDWERFETGVPMGLDACHYGVNAVMRRDGVSAASVREGLTLAGRAAPGLSCIATPLYLATITIRYLLGTLDARGKVIAPTSLVMIEALEGVLRKPTSTSGGTTHEQ